MASYKGDVLRKTNGVWAKRGNLIGDGPIPVGAEYLPTYPSMVLPGSLLSLDNPAGAVSPFSLIYDHGQTIPSGAGLSTGHLGPTWRWTPDTQGEGAVYGSCRLYQHPVVSGRVGFTTASGAWELYVHPTLGEHWYWRVNAAGCEPQEGESGEFSLSMWIYVADNWMTATSSATYLLRKPRNYSSGFDDRNPIFELAVDGATDALYVQVRAGGANCRASADPAIIPLREWSMLSVTSNSAGVALFVNGVEVGWASTAGSLIDWGRKEYELVYDQYGLPYTNICPDPWTIGIRHGWNEASFSGDQIGGGSFDGFFGPICMDGCPHDANYFRNLYRQGCWRYWP